MQISSTDVIVFTTLVLASGRVAYALVHDDIFGPLREKLNLRDFRKHGGEGPYEGNGFVFAVFNCVFCMSFWTSLLASLAWLTLGTDVVIFSAPLAIWALANLYAAKAL